MVKFIVKKKGEKTFVHHFGSFDRAREEKRRWGSPQALRRQGYTITVEGERGEKKQPRRAVRRSPFGLW